MQGMGCQTHKSRVRSGLPRQRSCLTAVNLGFPEALKRTDARAGAGRHVHSPPGVCEGSHQIRMLRQRRGLNLSRGLIQIRMFSAARGPVPHCPPPSLSPEPEAASAIKLLKAAPRTHARTEPAHSPRHPGASYEREAGWERARKESQVETGRVRGC